MPAINVAHVLSLLIVVLLADTNSDAWELIVHIFIARSGEIVSHGDFLCFVHWSSIGHLSGCLSVVYWGVPPPTQQESQQPPGRENGSAHCTSHKCHCRSWFPIIACRYLAKKRKKKILRKTRQGIFVSYFAVPLSLSATAEALSLLLPFLML